MTNSERTYTIRMRRRGAQLARTTGRATGTRHSEAFNWLHREARAAATSGRYDLVEIIDYSTKELILKIL